MKYEELTIEDQETVNRYFDPMAVQKLLTETQSLIDAGLTPPCLAEHYGTEVQQLTEDTWAIDINADKICYTIFIDKEGKMEIYGMIDFWDDDDGIEVFQYHAFKDEFFNIRHN